jgi:hypothetical protein
MENALLFLVKTGKNLLREMKLKFLIITLLNGPFGKKPVLKKHTGFYHNIDLNNSLLVTYNEGKM